MTYASYNYFSACICTRGVYTGAKWLKTEPQVQVSELLQPSHGERTRFIESARVTLRGGTMEGHCCCTLQPEQHPTPKPNSLFPEGRNVSVDCFLMCATCKKLLRRSAVESPQCPFAYVMTSESHIYEWGSSLCLKSPLSLQT